MKKVIYVLSLYDYFDESYEILSAYDSVEEAEKGMLNYYNNYIALIYKSPIANTIEEMGVYLGDNELSYEITDIYYYTR